MPAISVTFHGDSHAEIAEHITEWLAIEAPPGLAPEPETPDVDRATLVRRVLSRIGGRKSKQLLLRLAHLGVEGKSLELNWDLVKEFEVKSGTAFAGMIGPVNRRALRILDGQLLIQYPPSESDALVWRLSPEDARVVLDYYDAE